MLLIKYIFLIIYYLLSFFNNENHIKEDDENYGFYKTWDAEGNDVI